MAASQRNAAPSHATHKKSSCILKRRFGVPKMHVQIFHKFALKLQRTERTNVHSCISWNDVLAVNLLQSTVSHANEHKSQARLYKSLYFLSGNFFLQQNILNQKKNRASLCNRLAQQACL